jgi:hypothetical protein
LKLSATADMIQTLQWICELQPAYSPSNTAAMQERGHLIRGTLRDEIRGMRPDLRSALGQFGPEFDADASDGIGRKTEAPWVRFFARSMAPNPRTGYYVCIHFAADGSAVFVTLGCGGTIWDGGELRPISDDELAEKTGWAREVIVGAFGSVEPFGDQIVLGAKAPLPRTFEKATAIARRLAAGELNEDQFRSFLIEAAKRLEVVYEAQHQGLNLSSNAAAELMVEQLVAPGRAQATGQGFGLTAPERRAVEVRAMHLAELWLEAEGFTVKNVSANSPYDLHAIKGNQAFKIEVKGLTGAGADVVLMSRREVDLHQQEKGSTGLILVSNIQLVRGNGEITTAGGTVKAELGWDIDAWVQTPVTFKLTRNTA